MVQPLSTKKVFISLNKCHLCSTLCLKNAMINRGLLLELLTIDKIPFDKIFKKLLQTVKTTLLFYMAFQF